MLLHPLEAELIRLIRTKYRFGTLQIESRDGLPVFLLRTVEREKIGGDRLSTGSS